jgi:hypothetical protein
MWLVSSNARGAWHGWHRWGTRHPQSLLYGIWEVEYLSIDGQARPPLVTDTQRWRRVIFDDPDTVTIQLMDDSFIGGSGVDSSSYGVSIDVGAKTLALTMPSDNKWRADFTFDRSAQDRLALDGHMDGHKVQMLLDRLDRNKLILVSRRVHWVNEFPFNF